jgi:hypothetical protein
MAKSMASNYGISNLSPDGIDFLIFLLLGVKSEVKCFNQKWLHHHQLQSYSLDLKNKSLAKLFH